MKKLLIANRGEIALRIIRAARELGIKTVAVYAESDAGSLPTRLADEAIALKGSRAPETYLNQEKLLAAAVQTASDAIHPGYGFLAENAAFAEKVKKSGRVFVGPSPDVIRLMGDKHRAREFAESCGVPVLSGSGPNLQPDQMKKAATKIGYPLLVKAVAGGSGRGMRLVEHSKDLLEQVEAAKREAKSGFGDDTVILERFLATPRHIEVQVFGDGKGAGIHFGERECSLQRRHQKLVEEAPAPRIHPKLRDRICSAGLKIVQKSQYLGAGTIECLVEGGERADDAFFFLEMNTRIQVEHPVTEEVYGIDLVKLQLELAAGLRSLPSQPEALPRHAIEFRVYAEDPSNNFQPQIGRVHFLSRPGGPGLREDGWMESGKKISPYFDSLLCKLIVSGKDREEALGRARSYLHEFRVDGLETTLGFHRWLLEQPDFLSGHLDVRWLERGYRGQVVGTDIVGPLQVGETLDVSSDSL